MDHRAETWYRRRTSHWQDWPLAALLDAKQRSGARISVVMPARNEEQTVAGVVGPLAQALVADAPLVDELVLARAIPFRTLCEHHMLLFSGVAHVGYLPGERILGLSKLARLVGHFAARPQTQERLTMQVARCLEANLRPRGAGVVLEAGHTCMTQRGIRAHGATTVTSALLGTLRTVPRSRAEFFALARVPTPPGPT